MRLALATVLALAATNATAEPRDVPRGDPLRRALLDTVRPAAEWAIGGRIEFVVSSLREDADWAFLSGDMQRPGGVPILCEQTRMATDCGFMDGMSVFALLRDEGRRWRLVDMHVAPTDVSFSAWPEQYGAPCALILDGAFCGGRR